MTGAFLDVVTRALNYLYRKGRTGYWSDPRTTSEVIMALVASGETGQSEYLSAAATYLLSQVSVESTGGSWASELWDTSLAVRALHQLPANSLEKCGEAFSWMETKRFPDGSFDGEPWDTLFVALAALETGRREELLQWGSVDWLCSIQSQGGVLISPHYTGIFLQVLAGTMAGDLDHGIRKRYEEAKTKAFLSLSDSFSSSELWSPISWTNAYVLEGVSAFRHKQLLKQFPEIMKWFETHQSSDGSWDDVVRTAITVSSLCRLKVAYDLVHYDPMQPLDRDVYIQTVQSSMAKAIQARTFRPPLMLNLPLIARGPSGGIVITITPQKELYLAVLLALLGAIWAVVTNWTLIRSLFGR